MAYAGTRGTFIPLIVLQYRPHAPAAQVSPKMIEQLWAGMVEDGWESPVLMFRGGHLVTSAHVDVTGALGTGEVLIVEDQVLYQGPLTRPPAWVQTVR